MARTKYKQTFL